MYLQYGSYLHAANEASVAIQRDTEWSDGGMAIGYKETWHISGFLKAASSAALTTALTVLKSAYAIQGQNIALYLDDGSLTSHFLVSSTAIGGVKVMQPPSFPEGQGAEYSTFRTYSIGVEATIADPTVRIISFHETINFRGGGPRDVHLQPINGFPQKQRVAEATPYTVVQSGQSTGRFTYPTVPGPIWPAALKHDMTDVRLESPKRSGPPGRPTYSEYTVAWSYTFEAAVPLSGQPNRWIQ